MFHWENGWFPIDFPTNPSSKLLPDLVTCNSAISGGKKLGLVEFPAMISWDLTTLMGFSWDFHGTLTINSGVAMI